MYFINPREEIRVTCGQRGRGLGIDLCPGVPTCAWDDDDEAAATGQLADEVEVLAESCSVWDQVGRHGGLGFGLLQAAL